MADPVEVEERQAQARQRQAINNIVKRTGLSKEYITWFVRTHWQSNAVWAESVVSDEEFKSAYQQDAKFSVEELERYVKPGTSVNELPWVLYQKAVATQGAPRAERAEATQQGAQMAPGPDVDPWMWMNRALQIAHEQEAAGGAAGGAGAEGGAGTGAGEGLIGSVADVFSALTPEQLEGLGVGEINEKFGLQRLAIEDPEAFLQAMFDKSGVVASPPVYGFLRDLMPSITLLASTREGQDLINSPGGAIQLNKAINEVISQGYPSRGSILEGLSGLGGLGRAFLGEGQFDEPRQEFRFVAATLNDLIGPTMAQPLRQALFNSKTIETQGDRFLSASARGMYKGSFIDWLKDQGYPLPNLPAYTPTPGATGEAGAPFVTSETGGLGTTPSGTPAFGVKGGVYKGE
jgi:hypothetical protein